MFDDLRDNAELAKGELIYNSKLTNFELEKILNLTRSREESIKELESIVKLNTSPDGNVLDGDVKFPQ